MTYKDDCTSTDINELPDINSWCYPGQFRSLVRIKFDLNDVIMRSPGFNVKPVITHSIVSDVKMDRNFVSAPSIVSAAVSDAKVINQFVSAPSIVSAAVSDINNLRLFGVYPAISSTISSDISSTRALASAAAIGFVIDADIDVTNLFSSTPLLQTDAVSGVNLFNSFASTAAISWDINDDVALGFINSFSSISLIQTNFNNPGIDTFRSFSSDSVIDFILVCDGPNLAWNFSCSALIEWSFESDIDKFQTIASTASIVSSIVSDVFTEREFASTADIVSDISDPAIHHIRYFASTANIVSNISDPVIDFEMQELEGYDSKLRIIIPASEVDEDLTDFPIRINIDESSGIESEDLSQIISDLAMDYDGYNAIAFDDISGKLGDTFTGTNGDDPKTDLWTETDTNNYMDIQNNKLNFNSPVANANPNARLISLFQLTGDFDIQMDFDITSWDAPTDGICYAGAIRMRDSGGIIGWITRARSIASQWYYCAGTGDDTFDTSDLSGQLRVTRISGEVRAFAWDTVSSRWEWDGGTTGYLIAAANTEDLKVDIYFESENNSGMNANVDNFTINSGTVVWPDPSIYLTNQYKIAVTEEDEFTQQYVEIENVVKAAGDPPQTEWLGTWAYRKKIKLSASYIGETLSDVPVPISINPSAGRLGEDLTDIFTELGANSLKIAVTEADGITELPVEVSMWDNGNNRAQLFTKIATIAYNDCFLWVYYDSAKADNTTYVGIPGSTIAKTVWETSLERVINFNDPEIENLIVNGDFSDGENGWSYAAGIIHYIVGGDDQYINRNNQIYQKHAYQAFTTVIGRTYSFSFQVYTVSHTLNVYANDGSSNIGSVIITTANDNQWHKFVFTATTTTTEIQFWVAASVVAEAYYDNVSVIQLQDSTQTISQMGHNTSSYTRENALSGQGLELSNEEFYMDSWLSGTAYVVMWVGKRGGIDAGSEHILAAQNASGDASPNSGRIYITSTLVYYQTIYQVSSFEHGLSDTNYHVFAVKVNGTAISLFIDGDLVESKTHAESWSTAFYNICGKDYTSSVEYANAFGGLWCIGEAKSDAWIVLAQRALIDELGTWYEEEVYPPQQSEIAGGFVLHTKVPFISSTIDTVLWLHWDTTLTVADNTDYIGVVREIAAQNVWNDDFVLVSHLNNFLDESTKGYNAFAFDDIGGSDGDTFTGMDLDDPKKDLWSELTGFSGSYSYIYGNEFRVHTQGGAGSEGIESIFTLTGDFDIQVDWNMIVDPGATAGTEIVLEARIDGDNRMIVYYEPTLDDYRNKGFIAGTPTIVNYGYVVTSGKFRLVRVGSNWTGYRWAASAWVAMISNHAIGSGDVSVRVYNKIWGNAPNCTADYDDFIINAGTVVWPFIEGAPLYLEDHDIVAGLKNGKAIDFDGIGELINWGSAPHFDDIPLMTIETLFKATAWGDFIDKTEWSFMIDDIPATADDDFTGTDNDPPNPILWTSGGAKILSNKLRMSLGSSNTNDNTNSNFSVTGDFSIQVFFDGVSGIDVGGNGGQFGLVLKNINDNTDYCRSTINVVNGSYMRQTYINGGQTDSDIIEGTLPTTGLIFRIRRVGSDIYIATYYNSAWNETSAHAWVTDDIIIQIFGQVWTDNPTCSGDFDNFQVISGTVIWPYSDSLFFQRDSSGGLGRWNDGTNTVLLDTWHYGAITMTQNDTFFDDIGGKLGDTFTGNDGDIPNPDLWLEETPSDNGSIQNNMLNYSGSEVVTETYRIESLFDINGDFDVQVDIEVNSIATPSASYHYIGQLDIRDRVGGAVSQLYYLMDSSGNRHWGAGGSSTSPDVYATGITSDLKIRFTRSGSVIKAFIWNESQTRWEWNDNPAGKTMSETFTADSSMRLRISQKAGANLDSSLDNFTINSGTVVWSILNAPNFQLDGVPGAAVETSTPSGAWNLESTFDLNHGGSFAGLIGELRISKVIRSEAWRTTTYKTLNDQLHMYGYRTWASTPAINSDISDPDIGEWLGYYNNRIPVIVDSSLIDDPLTDFPLGIVLDNTNASELFTELDYSLEIGGSPGSATDDFDIFPAPPLWSIFDPYTNFSQGSGVLIMDTEGSVGETQSSILISPYFLSGDFSIKVRATMLTWTNGSASNYPFQFQVRDKGTGVIIGEISKWVNTGGDKYIIGLGEDQGFTSYANVDTITTFLMTRVSGVVKIFEWDVDDWKWNGSTAGLQVADANTADLEVRLRATVGTGADTEIEIDYYIINSVDNIIWPNNTHPNRKKIAVATNDGTELDTEIDWSDIENSSLVIHSMVPSISDTEDTLLFVYFDSSLPDNAEVGDTGSAEGALVWDANYVGVWHLNGEAADQLDSTLNNDGILSDFDENSFLNGSIVFNNVEDIAIAGYKGIGGSNNRTVEIIFKKETISSVGFEQGLVSWGENVTGEKWFIRMQSTGETYPGGLRAEFEGSYVIDSTDIIDNVSHHVAVVLDGTTCNDVDLFIDGALGTLTRSNGTNVLDTDNVAGKDVHFGALWNGSTWDLLTGIIAEVRISDIARSAAWIKASRETLLGDLLSYNVVEERPHHTYEFSSQADIVSDISDPVFVKEWLVTEGSAWDHRLKIVIDSSKIGENLTDFPLLVALTNSSGITNYDAAHFFATVSNSTKIAFTLSDGITQLYAEKDYTNVSLDRVAYHVKIPSIASAIDTEIYMYYDDSKSDNTTYIASITDGDNVWDADFIAVYHNHYYTPLSDSTSYNRHMTPTGIYAEDDDYDMRYGKAIESDSGSDRYIAPSAEDLRIIGDITIEVLLRRDKADSVNSYMIESGSVGESEITNVNYNLLFNGSTHLLNTFWEFGTGSWGGIASTFTLSDTSGVHYAAMARDISEKTVNFHLDENSEVRGYGSNNPSKAGSGNTQRLYAHNNHVNDKCFVGKMGEIRISKIVRSESWLNATNFTLDDNTNTYSYETL